MSIAEHDLSTEDLHPIDIVQTLATHRDWEFDRVGDDQIAMALEGAWQTYSLSIAWSDPDETLRLICTFEMDPPADRLAELYKLLDLAGDACWIGGFSLWRDSKLMAFRYGLTLEGGGVATTGQIDAMMQSAYSACERFYPAFQLVLWGEETAEKALEVAFSEAYGRA